ncbi:hypothetical protein CDL12_18292 [Handroanthus impetiginosus]|uniref:O-fucosyltransferase family protein n=1 Tax=Handroanthus impetiginosus TaxID=429701 RepID=A0A2G9GV95_9LAMI|nr:hypothetical protein CDL12_18292 [Handroanthus impetiginosus]
MHAYNRLPSSGHSSPSSPPASPLSRSPRYRHRGSKSGRPPPRTLAQRLAWTLLSVLLKRQGIFLFAPLLYIAGMLFYMGTVSFDVVPVINHRPAPGSVYRSPQLYAKLRPEMDADNSSADAISTIWKHSYKGGEWRPCISKSSKGLPESNGYIFVEANGGLNQQRTSICNAVAVAGYLNATLVIPNFHFHSIWRDPSKFGDIYDEEFFIKALENDVQIVDTIPAYIMERFDYNMSNVYNFRIKAWSSIKYYSETVLPKLLEENNDGGSEVLIMVLVCRRLMMVCVQFKQYSSLPFWYKLCFHFYTIHVTLAWNILLHLFLCAWGFSSEKQYHDDSVVGLMLRGMGFDRSTSIYLASGKIYDSERYMAPLLEMFPLLQTKEMLASAEELAPFQNYSSRMAAIDYTVCLHSEVFVTTQGGNFPHFLLGHRRYLYGGHSRTIRPDKRKLALLFDNPNIGWKSFKRQMLNMRAHSDSKGIQLKRPNDSIYSFPCPDCMCKVNKTEDSRTSSVT